MVDAQIQRVAGRSRSALAVSREVYGEMRQVLASLDAKVPESFRPTYTALIQKVDAVLACLKDKPTTQVPAAQEAAFALNHIASALSYMGELATAAFGQLNKLIEEFAPKAQALQALHGQIEWEEVLGGEKLLIGSKPPKRLSVSKSALARVS